MPTANPPPVRVRFAPSPTGHLHVGNVRTALFNWLFARQKRGTFILRIEDTDLERSEARFEDLIYDDLRWLGLDWDEGPDVGGPHAPYRQSERLDLYRQHAERLLSEGKAYLCFCTPEELERERQKAVAEHLPQHYSGKCRTLDATESKRRRAAGEAAAIRLSIPERPIRFYDLVRGDVEFAHEAVGDPIILRSNGMPVYNYVVVIDDAAMQITHVIRGDDHLSNTPKQVALYEALGWPVPEFAHLSTILGSDRERLSKRHGATSIENFRSMGVLPEALMNYLALLGWAPSGGDREVFSREELVKEFALERVTPSPAVFDMDKLHWLNRHYVKQRIALLKFTMEDPNVTAAILFMIDQASDRRPGRIPQALEILKLAWPYFEAVGYLPDLAKADGDTVRWLAMVIELLAASVDRLEQLPERAAMIFRSDAAAALASPDNAEVLALEKARAVMESFARKVTQEAGPLSAERFKELVNEVKAETGAKGKELFHPIRIIVTGSHSGPEFDKLIPILEEGSRLVLPQHVKSVRERAEEFAKARTQA